MIRTSYVTQLLSSKPTHKYMRGINGHQEAESQSSCDTQYSQHWVFLWPLTPGPWCPVSSYVVANAGKKVLFAFSISKLLYCSPLSTTKFYINFLDLINHINLDLFEAKCILISKGPAVLFCWDIFPEAGTFPKEWDT